MEPPPLTAEPSATEQPYLARRQNWTNQLARHALMQPADTALRFMGRTTTWGELDDRVTKLAGALSRRGVGFGDRVLILMLNRTEFIESVLAVNKLGGIAVPVKFRITPPEMAFLVPAQWQVVCAAQRANPRDPAGKVLKTELRQRYAGVVHRDAGERCTATTASATGSGG